MNRSNTFGTIQNLEVLMKLLDDLNLIGKDKYLVPRDFQEVFEGLHQPLELIELFAEDEDCLADILVGHILLPDNNLNGISQDV